MANLTKNMLMEQDIRGLYEFAHTFAAINTYLEYGLDKQEAVFDLYVRNLPNNRNYLVFSGLEEVLREIINIKFIEPVIKYLKAIQVISEKTAKFLKKWKFKGSIYAMDEGQIFFGYEPVIKVKANIIDAQLLNINLIMAIGSHSIFTSKYARAYTVCKKYGRNYTGSPVRAQSFESGIKARRASYICGASITPSIPAPEFKLGMKPITPITVAQHSFIMSFEDEEEAMESFMRSALDKEKVICMVDTYDHKKGAQKFINVLKKLGIKKTSLYVDSGDILKVARYYRKILDENGFKDSTILASSNLNEMSMLDLCRKKAPVDLFIPVTEMMTSSDSPYIDFVYKCAMIKKGGKTILTGKLAENKVSYPGDKQVMRLIKKGIFKKDIICLVEEEEHLKKKGYAPLLEQFVKDGVLVKSMPDWKSAKEVFVQAIEQTPEYLKDLDFKKEYPVRTSPGLLRALAAFKERISNNKVYKYPPLNLKNG